MRALPIFGREKVAAMGPLPQTKWRFQSLAIREDQDKRKFVQISHLIYMIVWDLLGSFRTIIQLFSGCQHVSADTLRRGLRLLLRELRLNDLQLQDGSAGTAQRADGGGVPLHFLRNLKLDFVQ